MNDMRRLFEHKDYVDGCLRQLREDAEIMRQAFADLRTISELVITSMNDMRDNLKDETNSDGSKD
jgi:hypothetical protein